MDWLLPLRVGRRWWSSSPLRKRVEAVTIFLFLVVTFSILAAIARRKIPSKIFGNRRDCSFPAVFNFGDSNSDTGGKSAAFRRLPSPNGDTFFHKPSGRYCDGKVILDFMAEKLGLPYVDAYLNSIETNFLHGANFATGGSPIQPLDSKIFALSFCNFPSATSSYVKTSLPRPEDFPKALYTLDIGQNDLTAGIKSMTEKQLLASMPHIIDLLAHAVEKLYQLGARVFWIHNTGPIGCLPYSLIKYPPKPGNMDQNGCIKSHNEIAKEFNRQLKETVSQLRVQLSDAVLTYVDVFSAKYSLISEAQKHGFVNPLGYCCGHDGDYYVQCGKKAMVNGTEIFGAACSDPSLYISWDSIHYSHAANRWIAYHIVDGSLSDPPVAITQACHGPARS
ncbi:hypothetical protein FEM48_Zijuj10G0055600 [Ziziphus jujuba var. spinosa]|uniref:GDSL esterase/lipase At5g14450-like n=1 Tax=Ziziphus jujuba var. spinosa TaxID=714518 RepID=A0A978ULL1_ZIZJJ|nr:hypothetical protein FEM48_Zijuj10G0055600 [Ziziphus jujuba var. spinosa]